MLIPYARTNVLINEAEEFFGAQGPIPLTQEQKAILRATLEGGRDLDDLAQDFRSAWAADPGRTRQLVRAFLENTGQFGVADIELPPTIDAVIIDRGWQGVFQHAVDLWHLLNTRYCVLLIAPVDPYYSFDSKLATRMLTPKRWGGQSGSLVECVSVARTVLLKSKPKLALLTHRAMMPFFFDIAHSVPTIAWGDDYGDFQLMAGRHLAEEPPEQNVVCALQDVLFAQTNTGPWNSLAWAKASYWTLKNAAETWFWTQAQLEHARKAYPQWVNRFRRVFPLIDTARLCPGNEDGAEPVILFSTTNTGGQLGAKGLDPLFRAFIRLPEKARLRLVVHNAQEVPVEVRNLGNRVQIHERLPKDEMLHVYRSSLVNCRVSRMDSSPVSILESMSAGLPVIVSKVIAGNIPTIQDGITGFVVDPEDVDGLERRLRELLENRELRNQLGRRGREAVLSYSFQSNLGLFERYLAVKAQEELESVAR